MSDKLSIDTLDILAAAAGLACGLILLPADAALSSERILVGICIFIAVSAKRLLIETKPDNPHANRFVRMTYLFIAIIGTGCCALALLGVYGNVEEFNTPHVINGLTLTGGAMLIVAAIIDYRWLKR